MFECYPCAQELLKRQFLKIHNVSLGMYTKHCLYNKMFKFVKVSFDMSLL